jgi:hypothetical protein
VVAWTQLPERTIPSEKENGHVFGIIYEEMINPLLERTFMAKAI